MRKTFIDLLYKNMESNTNIVVLNGDLGYGLFEIIEKAFPDRFINCGSSEQLMVAMAIGASLEGKIPIVFSITSFLIYRPFEILRTYVNHEKHPIKLVGCNRDYDYKNYGISHYAHDVLPFLSKLENIKIYYPNSIDELDYMFTDFLTNNKPSFLSLTR